MLDASENDPNDGNDYGRAAVNDSRLDSLAFGSESSMSRNDTGSVPENRMGI